MVNNVSKPTAKLIKETFLMVHHMQEKATYLINTYLSLQGAPFNDEGFNIPDIQIIHVPQASMPHLEWLALSDADRMLQNFKAYHIIFKFLEQTLSEQHVFGNVFGNTHEALLDKLTNTLVDIQDFLGNLSTLMLQMVVARPAMPESVPVEYSKKAIFQKRLRGYVVCREYKDWIDRTANDFQLLHKKYPYRFSVK